MINVCLHDGPHGTPRDIVTRSGGFGVELPRPAQPICVAPDPVAHLTVRSAHMAGERLLRILAQLAARPDDRAPSSVGLCEVAAEVTAMSGAGIMLMTGDVARGSLCSSNRRERARSKTCSSRSAKGPCIDAYRARPPGARARPRRSRHRPAGSRSRRRPSRPGSRAVFGFPVQVGVVRLGALNLYSDRPGALTHDQHADSLVMADVAARAVLAMQADAPPGAVAAELEVGRELPLGRAPGIGHGLGPTRRERRSKR